MQIGKELIGLFLVLIALYLVVKNADGTDKVIKAFSAGIGDVTANLQGRSSGVASGLSQ